MVINKPFKNYVRELFEKIIDENLEVYVEETLSVAKRRISSTKWIADSLGKFKKQPDHDKTFFFEM